MPVNLRRALNDYADHHEDDVHAAACIAFLDEAEHPFDREHLTGHFTGSAWLVSADGEKVLLTHHRKLNRWLQLGGHADGDSDLAAVALREAHEESGLTGLRVEPNIFDVDRHWIPERKSEPGHWHHDVRYVVWATLNEAFVVSDESLELAWVSIHQLADAADTDESLRRMARKWLARA
ncbi:NUDIX hydrolase [Dyella caseinilytica]|uniref:NUDIX hydrolase n=1 Tax=Dyella caseinilytica TaxID=1849581 RepID=A0ABX7GPV7_9GAMM|nr:NUDIX hydrolase [Dyella caseinilytica]QRN52023.1 NUDIX hydrolase [Dyella caseinilytica]GGA04309.1 NUDIX hydrolase [Dyella caseinilytica]